MLYFLELNGITLTDYDFWFHLKFHKVATQAETRTGWFL